MNQHLGTGDLFTLGNQFMLRHRSLELTAMVFNLELGTIVILKRFNGTTLAPFDVALEEDFWKLVGVSGTVIDLDPPTGIELNRVLVLFAVSLHELSLPNHNAVAGSLWISREDLAIAVTPHSTPLR